MAAQFVKYGIPMLVEQNIFNHHIHVLKSDGMPYTLIVGGSFALKEFTEIKIKRRDEKIYRVNKEEALKALPHKEKEVSIEDVYKDISKNLDIENWENKRGPRPWEEQQKSSK